jgi:hypothetical protein
VPELPEATGPEENKRKRTDDSLKDEIGDDVV